MIISILFSMFSTLFSNPQHDWSKLSSLELYPHVKLQQVDTLSAAALAAMPHETVDVKEARTILTKATVRKQQVMYKGASRLAVATFADGSTSKLFISSYGGFFYDSGSKSNYILPEEVQAAWYQLLEKYKAE